MLAHTAANCSTVSFGTNRLNQLKDLAFCRITIFHQKTISMWRIEHWYFPVKLHPSNCPSLATMQMNHIWFHFWNNFLHFKKSRDVFCKANRSSEIFYFEQMDSFFKIIFIILWRLLPHCICNIHIIFICQFIRQIHNISKYASAHSFNYV